MILNAVLECFPKKSGLAGALNCSKAVSLDRQTSPACRRSLRAGTLIEVVLATFILAIMGAAIASSINYGMFMLRLARENARATQVLIEKSEALRLYNWDQIVYSNGFIPATFPAVYDPQDTNHQGVVYNGAISISNVPFAASYATNLRQCTITLQWVTAGKINHNRSLTTYIARQGLQNYVY